MMELVSEAIVFAVQAHDGMRRKTSLQILSIIVIIWAMVLVVTWGQKTLSVKYFNWLLLLTFAVYAVGNLYCTLFSRVPGSGGSAELKPFMSIVRLFTNPVADAGEVTGVFAWFMQGSLPISGIILNILLYLPLGYLLATLFPALRNWQILLIGCLCSVATELVQFGLEMGYCETDDVLYNTLGTAIGVWVWHLQSKRLKTVADQNSDQD